MSSTWILKSTDGKITKITSKCELGLSYSIGDKPHETSKCVFDILSVNVTSPEKEKIMNASYYLNFSHQSKSNTNYSEEVEVMTRIGISSVSDVDRLIDMCLMTMIKEEIAQFCIECFNNDTKVDVQLKLKSFEDSAELFEMIPEEILELSSNLKADGVKLYSEQRLEDAFHKFSKALKYLITIDPLKVEQSHDATAKLKQTLLTNLAGCHISSNFKNWDYAIELCSEVLENDSCNIKALYRRGVAYLENQDYVNARQDFLRAKELDPHNHTVKSKLDFVNKKENQLKQKYATAMKKMFS